MNTPPVSNAISTPGEKTIYQTQRSASAVINAVFGLILAFVCGAAYLWLSIWSQNLIKYSIPWLPNASNATTAQIIQYFALGLLVLAGLLLVFSFLQLITALGSRVILTDRRITGKTGRNILRKLDIPLENIAWVEYPNRILSKGPLMIHTKDGKQKTLANIGRVETFLGYLENAYPADSRPTIRRQTMWGQAVLLIIGLVLAGFALYILITDRPSEGAQLEPAATSPAVALLATEIPQPTEEPTLAPTPTKRPTATPKPQPVVVDFSSINNYDAGQKVIISGQLVLPGGMYCDTDCGVFLRNPNKYAEKITIFLNIPGAGSTPAPNEMARLQDNYQESDFRVRMENGKYAGNYSKVTVSGEICQTTSGEVAVCDIVTIEPYSQ